MSSTLAAFAFAVVAAPNVSSPRRRNPVTRRMRALAAWESLGAERRFTWQAYALHERRYDPVRGRVVRPSARTCYVRACLDRWSLDPSLDPPATAPAPLSEDSASIFVARRSGRHLVLEASAPLRPGRIIQVLLRRGKSWRAIAYVTFAPRGLRTEIALKRGEYDVATRVIDLETLQFGAIRPAGSVRIGRKPKPVPVAETILALPPVAQAVVALPVSAFVAAG